MDFIHDVLADGRAIRILSVVDVFSRECVGLRAQTSCRGEDVARVPGEIGRERALPPLISVDNGTEFTSKALDHGAYWNRVQLDFSRPGSQRTMPTWKRSTAASGVSACRSIGWSMSPTPSRC